MNSSEQSKPKLKKKITKTKEAKKVLKRKFKVNTKIVFTEEGELIQQWPPAQKKSVENKAEQSDDSGGIDLERAKERLQEEDKFDKEEYRKKIKEKHRDLPGWHGSKYTELETTLELYHQGSYQGLRLLKED
uniref:ATPdependent RNA helicase n=1 Tax=Sphaerodactylus townsendi TaxID=933632 RepID=A0ACB8FFV4_9SAUR